MAEWQRLAVAENDIDAQLLIGRLDLAGIESRAVKDRSAPGAWLYGGSNPWAPVEINVRPGQLDDAKVVLAELSVEGPDTEQLATSGGASALSTAWVITSVVVGLVLVLLAVMQVVRPLMPCQLPVLCS